MHASCLYVMIGNCFVFCTPSARCSITTITTIPPSMIPLTRGLGRSECRQSYPYKYHYSQRGHLCSIYCVNISINLEFFGGKGGGAQESKKRIATFQLVLNLWTFIDHKGHMKIDVKSVFLFPGKYKKKKLIHLIYSTRFYLKHRRWMTKSISYF